MPGQTIKTIIDKVFNKSVNLCPRYDLDYVKNYQGKCGYYDYNQIVNKQNRKTIR
jgi:hypothetical protein